MNGSYVMAERVGDVWHWHNSRGESGTAATREEADRAGRIIPRTSVPPEEAEKMVKMALEGKSVTAITQEFKRGSETVRNVLVGMGLECVGKTWRMREEDANG